MARCALATAALCLVLSSPRAWASRDALVKPAGAQLHQAASDGSPVVGSARAGQWLKVSDQPLGGWHRCLVPGSKPPQLAWVRADVIEVRAASAAAPVGQATARAARRENGGSSGGGWSLALVGDAGWSQPSGLQAASKITPGLSLGYAATFRAMGSLSERFSLGPEVGIYLLSGAVAGGASGGGDLTYSALAISLDLAMRFDLVSTPGFLLGVIGGAGISPLVSYSTAVASATASGSAFCWTVPVGLEADVRLSKSFGLAFEVGYRLISPLSPPAIGSSGVNLSSSDLSAILTGMGMRIWL